MNRQFKLTIIHTASMLNLRGSEFWVIDVANLLSRKSLSVEVVNFEFARRFPKTSSEIRARLNFLRKAFGNGVKLTRLSALSLRLPFNSFWHGTYLETTVDRYGHFLPLSRRFQGILNGSDVVYFVVSMGNPSYLLVVLVMSMLAGWKPVVAGIHVTPRIKKSELVLLKIAARVGLLRAIHIVNLSHEEELRKIGCRVVYIPNGVDFDRFYSDVEQKVGQESFTIVFVGAMTRAKGADLLPEIYKALDNQRIPFTLVICTSGGELERETREWSEGKPRVVFRGFVERDEISKIFAASSVAIFPSRKEAFPLACLEVQASGTPVVVSDVPGLTQAVTDNVTGVVVDHRNVQSFGEGITAIYSLWKTDRNSYLEMCRKAQTFVRDKFPWSEAVNKLDGLIWSAAE